MLRRTRSALSCKGTVKNTRYESFAAFISRLRKSFAVSYGAPVLDNLCFEFANYSWAPCDDTSMSFTAKSVNDLNMTLNKELDSLGKWLQGNKLSMKVLKTQAMVIGSRPNLKKISKKLVERPSFTIGGSDVEMVGNVKYLGVQIDRHLAWDEHIHFVRPTVSRAIQGLF